MALESASVMQLTSGECCVMTLPLLKDVLKYKTNH